MTCSQVVVSYGPKSGAEHLEDHGFVPVTKPEDSLWSVSQPMHAQVRLLVSALRGVRPCCVCGGSELSFEITEEDRFFDDKEDIIQSEKLQLRQYVRHRQASSQAMPHS
jgi:hypothetical protein